MYEYLDKGILNTYIHIYIYLCIYRQSVIYLEYASTRTSIVQAYVVLASFSLSLNSSAERCVAKCCQPRMERTLLVAVVAGLLGFP